MATTTTIEFDSELLVRLRARRPGKDDRTLLEELVRTELGFETHGEVQRRNALSEEEAEGLALHPVRDEWPEPFGALAGELPAIEVDDITAARRGSLHGETV